MNQEYEKEINLKNLFFSLLYRWRSLVAFAVLVALLMTAYKYVGSASLSSVKESDSEIAEENNHKQELYEWTLANYENQIVSYESQMNQMNDYMESSILMQIDPLGEYYSSADVYVEPAKSELQSVIVVDDSDVVYPLTQAYVSFVNKSIDLKEPADKYHVSEAVLRELISATASSNSDTVMVKVIADNATLADDLLDVVLEQIKEETGNISSDIMKHSIKIRNRTSGIDSDAELLKKKSELNQQLATLSNNFNKANKEKDALEEPELSSIGGATSVSVKSLLKYTVLGFVAGGFLLLMIYGLSYLLSGKIHTPAEIKDAFGYYMIGSFAPEYRHNGAIDRWLQKLAKAENRSDDVIYNRIASNIKSLAQDNKKILLTGTVGDELLSEVGTKLKELLPDLDITYSGSFFEDASVMISAAEADAVVLLEKCEESSFTAVVKEAESMQALDKRILGYIIR